MKDKKEMARRKKKAIDWAEATGVLELPENAPEYGIQHRGGRKGAYPSGKGKDTFRRV